MAEFTSQFWADYSAWEFVALDYATLVAVLQVSAIKQHEAHPPPSVDRDILDGIIAATLPMIPPQCPAPFLPTCAVGKSDKHSRLPGTLTLSASTLIAMWSECNDPIAAAVVRRLVVFNSHSGQMAPLDLVARDLQIRHGMIAVAANWFAMGLPARALDPHEAQHGIHAGEMEASMMLSLRSERFAMAHARDFVPLSMQLTAERSRIGLGPGVRLGWQAQDLHPVVACGNAAAATLQKGQAFIEHAARQLVALLHDVATRPLSVLDRPPDPDAPE